MEADGAAFRTFSCLGTLAIEPCFNLKLMSRGYLRRPLVEHWPALESQKSPETGLDYAAVVGSLGT